MNKKFVVRFYKEVNQMMWSNDSWEPIGKKDICVHESKVFDQHPLEIHENMIEFIEPDGEYDYMKIEERYVKN